jgi:pimeloyl-ACP methyl ester carboxylesterase
MSTQQTAKTQYISAPDATTFGYRRLGTGNGTPLVMLTHFRGTMDKWDPALINTLASQRQVITVDYKGVGHSNGEVATSVRESAADIALFVEALLGEGAEIDVLGFSLGGYVAQMVAHNADQARIRVRKLILAGTGTSFGPELVMPSNQDVGAVAGTKSPTVDTFKTLFFPKNREGDAAASSWWARIHERSEATSGEQATTWVSDNYADQGKGLKAQVMAGQAFTSSKETSDGLDGSYDRLKGLAIPILIANGHVSLSTTLKEERIE